MKKFLTIVAIGVAVKYYLDTEEGKQIKGQLMELLSAVKDVFGETIKKSEGKIGRVMENAGHSMTS